MDSKSFPTKVGHNIMEGFGRLPFPISYACTIYTCVCVCERKRERERERERDYCFMNDYSPHLTGMVFRA